MSKIPRLIPYYGAKHSIAPKYPPPEYDTIIEPFAGSAGYSSLYSDREVILIDKDPIIAGIWNWLIKATKEEILELPLIQPGELVEDLDTHQVAKWLIGFWCNDAIAAPRTMLSSRSSMRTESGGAWGLLLKTRIAEFARRLDNWYSLNADYDDWPNEPATWFIDPPYSNAHGRHYRYNSIDYDELAEFCLTRKGQVIVCESEGADWLPFDYLTSYNGQSKSTHEMIFQYGSNGWKPPTQPFNPQTDDIIDYLRV